MQVVQAGQAVQGAVHWRAGSMWWPCIGGCSSYCCRRSAAGLVSHSLRVPWSFSPHCTAWLYRLPACLLRLLGGHLVQLDLCGLGFGVRCLFKLAVTCTTVLQAVQEIWSNGCGRGGTGAVQWQIIALRAQPCTCPALAAG